MENYNEVAFICECKKFDYNMVYTEGATIDAVKVFNKIKRSFKIYMDSYKHHIMMNDIDGAKEVLEDAEHTIEELSDAINSIPDTKLSILLTGIIIPTCTALISLFVSYVFKINIPFSLPEIGGNSAYKLKPLVDLARPVLLQLRNMGSSIALGNCAVEAVKVLSTVYHSFKAMTSLDPSEIDYNIKKSNVMKNKCIELLMQFKFEVRALQSVLSDVEKNLKTGDATALYNVQAMMLPHYTN